MKLFEEYLFYLISNIIVIIYYVYLAHLFLISKKALFPYRIVWGLSLFVISTLYFLCYERDFVRFTFLFLFLYIILFFDNSLFQKIFFILASVFSECILEILFLLSFSLLTGQDYGTLSQSNPKQYILFVTVICLGMILCYEGLKRKNLVPKKIDLRKINPYLLTFFFIFLFLLFCFIFFIDSIFVSKKSLHLSASDTFYLISLSFGVILFFLIIILIHHHIKERDLRAKNKIISDQLTYRMRYYQGMEKNTLSIRKIKHDMKNHLLSLQHLLQDDDINAAQTYVADILSRIHITENLIHTGNPLLDAILNEKFAFAKTHRIGFEVSAQLPSEEFLPNIDLCTIVANTIDNAVEACQQVPLVPERQIRLRTFIKSGYWVYHLSNSSLPIKAPARFSLQTTKKNKAHHGLGLLNVQDAVLRHGGTFAWNYVDGIFSLEIGVPVRQLKLPAQ